MGALDAFYSTWSDARETFGQGTPQDGSNLDNSSKLMQMKAGVEAAAPDGRWQGPASEAYGAKNKEHAGVYGKLAELDTKMATEVTNASNVVASGRLSLENTKSWVDSMANSIPPGTSAADRDNKLLSIANQGIGRVSDTVAEATNKMTDISGRVETIKGQYQALADGKPTPSEKKPGDKPDISYATDPEKDKDGDGKPDEEKSPAELGAEDSHALQNGDLTPEQRQRLIDNTTLDPAQQTALDNGTLQMSPERMAYLQGFSRAFGDKTPAEIKAAMENADSRFQGTGGRVADVFQLASNANIKTGEPGTEPPSIDHPASGGKYALPEGIQKVLDGPVLTPLELGPPKRGEDGSIGLPDIVGGSQTVPGLNDLANIIQEGNRNLQAGTDLDSGLFAQSQRLLEESNGWAVPQGAGDLDSERARWYHHAVDPTLQNMFNAVNKDEVLIHDTVTGSGGQEFLDNLTRHQWQDDGLAAGGLFDWISDSAANDPRNLASETAHAIADFASSAKPPDLLNLPGADGQSLGQVNPELTRDWARALTPYFDDMVGGDSKDSNGRFAPLDAFSPLDPKNDITETRRLMSVLMSDHPPLDKPIDGNTPLTASQIVAQSVQAHVENSFDQAALSVIDGEPGERYSPLATAGRLQGAMDLGAYDERFDATHDVNEAQKQAHTARVKVYEAMTAGVGLVPHPGATVLSAGAGFMKDFIFGQPPGMPNVAPPATQNMFPLEFHMAETLAEKAAGNPELLAKLPPIGPDGNFVLPEHRSAEYDRRLYDNIHAYVSGFNEGLLNDMTTNYWQWYTSTIMNTAPPPSPR